MKWNPPLPEDDLLTPEEAETVQRFLPSEAEIRPAHQEFYANLRAKLSRIAGGESK